MTSFSYSIENISGSFCMLSERGFNKQHPVFVLVGGRSGVGKTTLVNSLINNYPHLFVRPKSFTSRKPRGKDDFLEYTFVTKNSLIKMYENGELINLDEVYGEYYGIGRLAITEQQVLFIKEVHPKNHQKIKDVVPNSISILYDSINRVEAEHRREQADDEYYNEIDLNTFDIVMYKEHYNCVNMAAEAFKLAVNVFSFTSDYYPSAPEIDTKNATGYAQAAPEFIDELRITTKNFHDLTAPYFIRAFDELAKTSERVNRCLEVGPGRGWLRETISLDGIEYIGVDIAQPMIDLISAKQYNDKYICSSVRLLPFESESFDLIVGSLADPYFYPLAICELRRVLRPGGTVIFSVPSRYWSNGLREQSNQNITRFNLANGEYSEVYSFSFTSREVETLLSLCGFDSIDCWQILGEELSTDEISPAINKSALNLAIPLSDLPIINFITARRGDS